MLIGIGGLLALPVFTLPAILAGVRVSQGLVRTALLGLAGFAVFSVIILRTDWPLEQRDAIRRVLGRKWWQAILLTAGRLGFDFGCLLAALRATGADPQPSVVLLAYSAAGIVALLPLTPGGWAS